MSRAAGRPPAARNAPPNAATSSSATMRSLKRATITAPMRGRTETAVAALSAMFTPAPPTATGD